MRDKIISNYAQKDSSKNQQPRINVRESHVTESAFQILSDLPSATEILLHDNIHRRHVSGVAQT